MVMQFNQRRAGQNHLRKHLLPPPPHQGAGLRHLASPLTIPHQRPNSNAARITVYDRSTHLLELQQSRNLSGENKINYPSKSNETTDYDG